MRVGALDIGSNSTRLLIADVEGEAVSPLETGLITTRLGEGIGEKKLTAGAVDRTVNALQEFCGRMEEAGVEAVLAGATSAARDAKNSWEFVKRVREDVGINVNILTGEDEARLTYKGVLAGFDVPPENAVVVDVGGGSTEFIWRSAGEVFWKSVNAGAVRMTGGKHTGEEIKEILKPALDDIFSSHVKEPVGVGGTITNLAAMALELKEYDPQAVHGYKLYKEKIREIAVMLENTPLENRGEVPGLQPSRADIIDAGTKIVEIMLEELDFDYIKVSEADILYGLALEVSQKVERYLLPTYLK